MDKTWIWVVGAWFTATALSAFNGDPDGRKDAVSLALDMLWAVVFSAAWPLVALIWCGMEIRARLFRIPPP